MTKSCLQQGSKGNRVQPTQNGNLFPMTPQKPKKEPFKNNVLTGLFLASHQKTSRLFFSSFCMTKWMTVIMFCQMFSVLIIFSVMQLENVKTVPVFAQQNGQKLSCSVRCFLVIHQKTTGLVFFRMQPANFKMVLAFV